LSVVNIAIQYNLMRRTLGSARRPSGVQELQNRFTVYDVFAVLIPGVTFLYLLAFTLDRAVGVRLFDWTGAVGDAALLLIFGYATGTLLHALGNALIERPWRFIRGVGKASASGTLQGEEAVGESLAPLILAETRQCYVCQAVVTPP
jgi:hypothetical protein